MRDVNEAKIKKVNSITIPSFSLNMADERVKNTFKVNDELFVQGGVISSQISLISGLPCEGKLKDAAADNLINEPFIFAIND